MKLSIGGLLNRLNPSRELSKFLNHRETKKTLRQHAQQEQRLVACVIRRREWYSTVYFVDATGIYESRERLAPSPPPGIHKMVKFGPTEHRHRISAAELFANLTHPEHDDYVLPTEVVPTLRKYLAAGPVNVPDLPEDLEPEHTLAA